MITNRDLLKFGREQEEKRLGDRAVFLLHRIRVIDDDMKVKLETLQALRREYDDIKAKQAAWRQVELFDQKTRNTLT